MSTHLHTSTLPTSMRSATRNFLAGMTIHDDAARRRIERDGFVGLGETYEEGCWSADHLDDVIYRWFSTTSSRPLFRVWGRLLGSIVMQRLVDAQAGRGAFRIGQQHYDLGNDLFRVMLDDSMTYTSGYWRDAMTLNEAQTAKLDLICRKLNLKPQDHVLDIGCGWGNFAQHAASRYGARITGVTVSEGQAALARERCEELPVDIRVEDYRTLDEQFDHVVSIEMIEAVGRRNLPTFFATVDRCLRPDGLYVQQVITGDTMSRTSDRRLDQFIMWLRMRIFPDGYLPNEQELVPPRDTSLRIQDWQRYVNDYEQTLLAWAANVNAGWDNLASSYDERFHRRWNFYLHSCVAAFRARLIDVQQITYSKGGTSSRFTPVR